MESTNHPEVEQGNGALLGRCISCETNVWADASFGDSGRLTPAGPMHASCESQLTTEKPPTKGRPEVWDLLTDKLIAEGFLWSNERCEWVNLTTGERGRCAWAHDDSSAWLHLRGLPHPEGADKPYLVMRDAKPEEAAMSELESMANATPTETLMALVLAAEDVNCLHPDWCAGIGQYLTCEEADALVSVFSAIGCDDSAFVLADAHAASDTCGDAHHTCPDCEADAEAEAAPERCAKHPAFDASYCPGCGTATRIPTEQDLWEAKQAAEPIAMAPAEMIAEHTGRAEHDSVISGDWLYAADGRYTTGYAAVRILPGVNSGGFDGAFVSRQVMERIVADQMRMAAEDRTEMDSLVWDGDTVVQTYAQEPLHQPARFAPAADGSYEIPAWCWMTVPASACAEVVR